MKTTIFAVSSLFAAMALTGCGGSSGGSSGGSGSGGGGGSNSATFGGHLVIVGGNLAAPTTGNATQTIQLIDAQGNSHTLNSIYSPESLPAAPVVVLRAGANLFSGHYTSTTANYISPLTNASIPVPLTSAGLLAQDTAIEPGGQIVLPIDKVGAFSTPNGITVQIVALFHFVEDDTLTLTGSATLASASQSKGQLTFTGTSHPTGSADILFRGAGLVQVGGADSQSPCTLSGEVSGQSLQFPTVTVEYEYNN